MASLHNRTRPAKYKSWLTDCSQAISDSTLRSREAAKKRKVDFGGSCSSSVADQHFSDEYADQNYNETAATGLLK
jgi:hypothetical protein